MSHLKAAPTITLLDVVNDGLREMEEANADGFEYIIGMYQGAEIKVVLEPTGNSSLIQIDGVNGFGYTLLFEEEAAEVKANTYTVKPGEMLGGIALRKLGSEDRWPEIQALNPDTMKSIDPNRYLEAGTVILLPVIDASEAIHND